MSEHDDAPWSGADPAGEASEYGALVAALRSTFVAHASTLVIEDRPFSLEPDRPDLVATPAPATANPTSGASAASPTALLAWEPDRDEPVSLDVVRDRAGRRARLAWVAAWVAVLVLAASVAIGLVTGRSTQGPAGEGLVDATVGEGTAVLVPTWVPDGLELWGVEASSAGLSSQFDLSMSSSTTQLLRSASGGRVMVTSIEGTIAPPGPGDAVVALRGTEAAVRPKNVGSSLDWIEDGVAMQARFRDVPQDEAVALVEGLRARDAGDLLRGFEPPAVPGWTLDDEAVAGASELPVPERHVVTAAFSYFAALPAGNESPVVRVMTFAPGADLVSRLEVAFNGRLEADGTAVSTSDLPLGAVGTLERTTIAVFADGRSVSVASRGPIDEAVALRIARDSQVRDLGEVRRIKRDVSARLAAAPVLATADLPSGRVELRGQDRATVICFTRSGSAEGPDCTGQDASHFRPEDAAADALIGTTSIDGTWFVFAASPGEVRLGAPGIASAETGGIPSGTAAPGTPDAAVERATSDGFTMSLLAVPDGVDWAEVGIGGFSSQFLRVFV